MRPLKETGKSADRAYYNGFFKREPGHTCGYVQRLVEKHETGTSQRELDENLVVVRLEVSSEEDRQGRTPSKREGLTAQTKLHGTPQPASPLPLAPQSDTLRAHLPCQSSLDPTPPSRNTPPSTRAPTLPLPCALSGPTAWHSTGPAAALTLLDTLEPEGVLAVFDHGQHVPDGEPRHGGLVNLQQQLLRHQLAAALIGHLAGLHLPQVGELSILGAPLQFKAQLALRVPANDTLMDFASPVAFLFQAFGHGSEPI
ncbi:PREDICTED: uncharacterized protein LOC103588600 [Galeopterus variegatus]|uniref:Uncharacterized protein LOC103588600 n=1 Tax=Galeopterus variegatus TaxID=482537 RepID=A0ABM0QJK1_GALVR|nr:PREDICTED: uncharacterized protein LOC103588600 [Galeopterus variegatus]